MPLSLSLSRRLGLSLLSLNEAVTIFVGGTYHYTSRSGASTCPWFLVLVCREYRNKTFTKKGDDPDQRSYTQRRVFVFSPETSAANAKESDIIYTINIPLVVSKAACVIPQLASWLSEAMVHGMVRIIVAIHGGLSCRPDHTMHHAATAL